MPASPSASRMAVTASVFSEASRILAKAVSPMPTMAVASLITEAAAVRSEGAARHRAELRCA